MNKRKPLNEIADFGRPLIRTALEGWRIPAGSNIKPSWNTWFDPDEESLAYVSLIIPGKRRDEGTMLALAHLDRCTGEGTVQIFTEHLEKDAK